MPAGVLPARYSLLLLVMEFLEPGHRRLGNNFVAALEDRHRDIARSPPKQRPVLAVAGIGNGLLQMRRDGRLSTNSRMSSSESRSFGSATALNAWSEWLTGTSLSPMPASMCKLSPLALARYVSGDRFRHSSSTAAL